MHRRRDTSIWLDRRGSLPIELDYAVVIGANRVDFGTSVLVEGPITAGLEDEFILQAEHPKGEVV